MRPIFSSWWRHRRHRESGWTVLLVLGGSVAAAVLLIHFGVAMVAGAELRDDAQALRQAARTAQRALSPVTVAVAQAR